MTPDEARAMYSAQMDLHGETISIRRYTGTGTGRTYTDRSCRARGMGYAPNELVGSIVQGDRKVVVLAEDLESPKLLLKGSDKVMVGGADLAIVGIDDSTRRIGTTLIAYELQCRGGPRLYEGEVSVGLDFSFSSNSQYLPLLFEDI